MHKIGWEIERHLKTLSRMKNDLFSSSVQTPDPLSWSASIQRRKKGLEQIRRCLLIIDRPQLVKLEGTLVELHCGKSYFISACQLFFQYPWESFRTTVADVHKQSILSLDYSQQPYYQCKCIDHHAIQYHNNSDVIFNDKGLWQKSMSSGSCT